MDKNAPTIHRLTAASDGLGDSAALVRQVTSIDLAGASPDTCMAIGEALAVLGKARALVDRDRRALSNGTLADVWNSEMARVASGEIAGVRRNKTASQHNPDLDLKPGPRA